MVPVESSVQRPLERFLKFVGLVLIVAASAMLLAMAALIAIDVVARYIFSAPLPGGFELVELMLATMIFTALPIVTAQQRHITIDLFDALTPKAVLDMQIKISNLIVIIMLCGIGYAIWLQAGKVQLAGLRTDVLSIPKDTPIYYMGFMSYFSALVLGLRLCFGIPLISYEAGGHE